MMLAKSFRSELSVLAFLIPALVQASAPVGGGTPGVEIQTGAYSIGDCKVEVSQVKDRPNMFSFEATLLGGNGRKISFEFDNRGKSGTCKSANTPYTADVKVEDEKNAIYRTLILRCGSSASAVDDEVILSISPSGKVVEAAEFIKIARLGITEKMALPFLQDSDRPALCMGVSGVSPRVAIRLTEFALERLKTGGAGKNQIDRDQAAAILRILAPKSEISSSSSDDPADSGNKPAGSTREGTDKPSVTGDKAD
jgi:hypothetical protein